MPMATNVDPTISISLLSFCYFLFVLSILDSKLTNANVRQNNFSAQVNTEDGTAKMEVSLYSAKLATLDAQLVIAMQNQMADPTRLSGTNQKDSKEVRKIERKMSKEKDKISRWAQRAGII